MNSRWHIKQPKHVALITLASVVGFLPTKTFAADSACKNVYVSPRGSDQTTGSGKEPIYSLQQAQIAVRKYSAHANVCVVLRDGLYTLAAPLVFTSKDGGQQGYSVTWKAAREAHPIISGGNRITGWSLFDKTHHIYVAAIPTGRDSRQLWINGVLADRSSIELEKSDIQLTATGFLVKSPALRATLSMVSNARRLELEATGISEDRYSPVARIDGDNVIMQQPAWDNNTWGYDTPNKPWNPEVSRLFLVNALELMGRRHEWHRNQDQWFLNPDQGKLYFKPADNVDIGALDIVLPRLDVLISLSGTYGKPIERLTFRGLHFSHTTWNGPARSTGYASQQSGAYLSEVSTVRRANAFEICGQGCPEFESMREAWNQMPAAVQVSAARDITFIEDDFTQLGQTALGIGNDADANLSGIGLGTDSIRVERNRFAVLSAGAIMAGGIRCDAHHPSDPRMVNRNLLIANNIITNVANDYKDTAAILSTYVDSASIIHNDISDANYDAIDVGWGWGIEDAGGNANYRLNMKGYTYNPMYSTPTTLRNTTVAFNRIHGVKKWFIDSGAIYNLSHNPHALIADNYIFDQGERTGIYLDEGSRDICVENNVIETHGYWLTANTLHSLFKLGVTTNNTAQGNWHNSDKTSGAWLDEIHNRISEDHLVPNSRWPAGAQSVIHNSGLESQALQLRSKSMAGPREIGCTSVGRK